MGKIDYQRLTRKEYEDLMREVSVLFHAIGLKQSGEALLTALLTHSERVMLARRIRIAREVLRGIPTRHIMTALGVGESTVQSVKRWLDRICPDHARVLQRISRKEDIRHNTESLIRFLVTRYPQNANIFRILLRPLVADRRLLR